MALTFLKEPSGIYPAYNDSFIEFTSSQSNAYVGEILITALSNQLFYVYPDASGKYLFNLKEVVRHLINANGLKDQDAGAPSLWTETYPYGYLSLGLTIRTRNTSDALDSTSKTYTFIRGVKQITEDVYVNTAQLLHPTDNGVDFNLTYFEGYPFSFELQRLSSGNSLTYRNINSGDETAAYVVASTNTQRTYVDKGSSNWTSSGYLPLTDTLNKIEVKVGGVVKSNINLKKVTERCGVYLKWFNNDGGYSYWLFDEYHKTDYNAKELGEVSSGVFENVGSHAAKSISIGSQVSESMRLKATIDHNEARHLRSLFSSPAVQMYSSQEPYVSGQWIDVRVDSSFQISNKRTLNEIAVDIELPNPLTPLL